MPAPPSRPAARLPEPRASTAAHWIGWAAYGVIALAGFCFGVWVGNQRPAPPVEVVKSSPKEETPAPKGAAPENPDKGSKKEPPPQPAAKKETPEPKTPTPEPKKAEPKPEAKAPEPKKTETPPAVTPVSFAEKVQPIFRAKCTICHGDTKGVKGGLDLRTLASIGKGGESGKALVPGTLKESSIWTYIDEGQMPPPDKPQLTDAEKKLIKDWILSGGK